MSVLSPQISQSSLNYASSLFSQLPINGKIIDKLIENFLTKNINYEYQELKREKQERAYRHEKNKKDILEKICSKFDNLE